MRCWLPDSYIVYNAMFLFWLYLGIRMCFNCCISFFISTLMLVGNIMIFYGSLIIVSCNDDFLIRWKIRLPVMTSMNYVRGLHFDVVNYCYIINNILSLPLVVNDCITRLSDVTLYNVICTTCVIHEEYSI